MPALTNDEAIDRTLVQLILASIYQHPRPAARALRRKPLCSYLTFRASGIFSYSFPEINQWAPAVVVARVGFHNEFRC